MTNWGDVAINEMANRDENKVREARYLADANHYGEAKPRRTWVDAARAIRHTLTTTRPADVTETSLNLDPRQKTA